MPQNPPWRQVRLREILTYVEELVPLDDFREYITITVKRRHGGLEPRERPLGHEIKTKKQYRLIPGAFLISRIQCWHQAYAIVPEDVPENMIASQNYDQFTISPAVDDRFFWWFSHSPLFTETVRSSAFGVVIEKMVFNRGAWLEKEIPLPPLDEQRRIVSRIEEMAPKIREALSLRLRAMKEAEQLGQSGIAHVFSNFNGAFRVKIEEVCEVRGGIQKSSARIPGANPHRYITVAHVQRNWIDTTDPRYFEVSDDELERWRLLAGDVLVIEGNGSSDQIGRAALFKGEIEDCVHQNHVIRIRPNQKKLMPEYLNLYLNSPVGRALMLEQSRTTSGLFNLSVGRIKALEVPLPSIEDQARVVEEADGLRAKVGALKKVQSETASELDALMPSILSRAFRGEL